MIKDKLFGYYKEKPGLPGTLRCHLELSRHNFTYFLVPFYSPHLQNSCIAFWPLNSDVQLRPRYVI